MSKARDAAAMAAVAEQLQKEFPGLTFEQAAAIALRLKSTGAALRRGQSKQDYVTPETFLAPVRQRLGITGFAFDFAADAANTKAPAWWGIDTNSLKVSGAGWAETLRHYGGGWGWLNPPFDDIDPWAQRCLETKLGGGSLGFLVPAAVGSNWFRDYVFGKAFVLLLNGRIPFMPENPTWGYPKDCMLCLYSPALPYGFEVWDWR